MPQQQRLAQKLITLEFKAQELLHGLLLLLPYHTIGLFVTKMTPEQYKTWEELELVIYTDATTILDKLIELKKKHNIPLKGIDTLSFHELNDLFIVYTGIEQQVLFLTAQAIFNPEKFIEGEEKKILLNQHLDKFADSLSEVKKHNALAKLTTEEKQLLGLL